MNKRAFWKRVTAAAIGAAAVTFGGTAGAAGFALIEQNASGLGNAYAGQSAAAEDASTIYFNPAGMTRLPGRQVVGAVTYVKPSTTFESNTLQTTLPPLITTGLANNGGNGGESGFPVSLYLSWEISPEFWLGVGVGTPFGLKTEWDSGWVGRFHGIKSEIKSININPSVAWKANEMLSIGFGLNAMYFNADLTNAVDYSAIAFARGGGAALGQLAVPGACFGAVTGVAPPAGGSNCEGVAQVKATSWGYGWNGGAMINFSPNTRLGLHYRSSVSQSLGGDVTFSNRPLILATALFDGPVKASITLPASFSAALSHNWDRWQFLADYTWTGWNQIQNLVIQRYNALLLSVTPLNFTNSWRAGVGVNYQLNQAWKLRAGVAYDTTPVQDLFRTPRLPDQDRTWLSIGAQWAFSKQGAIDFGYAHIFLKDASSMLPSTPAPGAPDGNLFGTYKAHVDILGIQGRFNF